MIKLYKKYFLPFSAAILFQSLCFGQKLNTRTYIFKFCDTEYNQCVSTCKVVIKGDGIIIYATKELAKNRTFTKEGDIINRGIILKHKSGKWIVGKTRKDIYAKYPGGEEGPAILDFTKKQYWTF